MNLESLTDRRLRELEDQRDKAEAVAHILQGQLTQRTRERDERTEERDRARDVAAALAEEALQLTDLLDDVTTEYGVECGNHDDCPCSIARSFRFLRTREPQSDSPEVA